jgi:hypothetical protein
MTGPPRTSASGPVGSMLLLGATGLVVGYLMVWVIGTSPKSDEHLTAPQGRHSIVSQIRSLLARVPVVSRTSWGSPNGQRRGEPLAVPPLTDLDELAMTSDAAVALRGSVAWMVIRRVRSDAKCVASGSSVNTAFQVLLPVEVRDGTAHISGTVKFRVLWGEPLPEEFISCLTGMFALDAPVFPRIAGEVFPKEFTGTASVVLRTRM